MSSRTITVALCFALALAGCSKKAADTGPVAANGPVAAVPPPPGKAWTDIVSLTPDGGMRMGNPDAPVKLVEYASFTCPHCKAFSAEASEPLRRDYIASGKLSWEFRSFLIHGPDAAVTLAVQCRGPAPFFPLSEQLFAAQDEWLNKLVAVPAATQQRWQSLPPLDQFKALLGAAGLRGFLGARGLPGAQLDACLADSKAADRMIQVRDHATNDLQVTGTPTFFINGAIQDSVFNWAELQPRVKAAVG